MIDFSLTKKQIAELEKAHRQLFHRKDADRIKAVLALADGWTPAQVAKILLFDEKTARNHFNRYQRGGINELFDGNYYGRVSYLDEKQTSTLEKHLEQNVYQTTAEVVIYVKKNFGVEFSLSGMTKLLHRLDFSYKKPKHVPGKADPKAQEKFVAKYKRLRKNKGKNDPIYFADATHPQHNSAPACGWIKKGVDKELQANCGRQRVNINGAINIETHEPVTEFCDSANAQSTIKLFKRIEAKHPRAKVIYIILDNARYYRSKLLRKYLINSRIKLIFLPPYSPNLNLIERYWKFFKKKVINNQYYQSFLSFTQACKSFFRKRRKYAGELSSLLTENFHIPTV